MKTTILYGLLLFSMVASLCGCTADELPDSSEASGDVESFSITVADAGGYASVSGGTPTRATENGYTTTFVEGDQIGVFAVKNNALMPGVNNLRLTATKDGESLVWLDNAGKSPLRYTGATYYAYYPYRDGIEGTPNNTNTDATSFFAKVINDWTPATNQGSSTAYSAQDLMIAANQPTGKQLSFSMSHCMALVVLDLPRTKYTFSNPTTIPPYIIDAPGTRFNSFIPYRMSDGTYRYLVKPAAAKALLSGSYTNAGNKVAEWTIDAKAIDAGTYKVFTVDKSIGIKKISHELQIGDFYMKDGSLVGKDKVLSAEEKADCIGIVMKVGKDDTGSWMDNCLYKLKDNSTPMDIIHGYVLALYNANSGNACQWGSYGTSVGTNTEQYTGFYGYNNTQTIIDNDNQRGSDLQNNFPATYYATKDYEEKYSAPTNSSGWFLPSAGQCWCWFQNRDAILTSMNKAGGNGWSSYYWSSSEYSYSPTGDAWCVSFSYGYVYRASKYVNSYVRSCLAF